MTQKPVHKITYSQLVSEGEPFRLLFPLGTLFGLIGVLLWPAYAWNLFSPYPALIHARIMLECFLAAFVIGFLGTALPRLLDVPRVRGREACTYAAGLAVTLALHLSGLHLWGDAAFLITFLAFVSALALRAQSRQDLPPPGFVLVILGIICALAGSFLFILSEFVSGKFAPPVYHLGRLLLYQGFVLFPIMGVGAFLLPRFFELPGRQGFPELRKPSSAWLSQAAFALTCGLLGVLSFILEVLGHTSAGFVLRGAAPLLYFWKEVPVHQANYNTGSLATALRVALFAIPLGYFLMALFPGHRITFVHVVFISGFSLLTFTVASRVILGHGGQSALFKRPLWSIRLLIALILVAVATRIGADWYPHLRLTHYAYAALAWVAAVAVWTVRILPGVLHPDE